MRRVGHAKGEPGIGNSLTMIRQAHNRLHLLSSMHASPTVLASQIELCNVLLVEISGIRSSLARNIKQTRAPPAVGYIRLYP
jgi:hypothetical protein